MLLAITLLMSPVAKADNVTVDQARDAAAHYLQHNTHLTRITADQLTLARQWDNEDLGVASMYLFKAPKEGWIIMAATTVMDPIVAFTDEGEFDGRMAPAQEWWLDMYNAMVCEVQNSDAEKGLEDSPEWTVLANHSLNGTKANVILLSTRWDQGGPSGTDYNIFSPVVNDSVAPTGCVATALAQICYYYGYPKQPKGKIVYTNNRAGGVRMEIDLDTVPPLDYSIMPLEIRASTSRERREEISRLDYYIGMSVKMQFGGSLSGSTDPNAISGMRMNMKYSRGTDINRRYTSDTNYLNSVKRELRMNRPLYMSGVSSTSGGVHGGGHAWVCDGYQDADSTKYHMNWGWGGAGNAFYNLVGNNMPIQGMSYYNFKNSQSIIVNMIPPQDSTDRQIIGIAEVEDATVLERPYPNPATLNVVLPYSTREAAELQVYNTRGCLVESRRVQAGDGAVTLRVDALPSGIYIYRMGNAYGKFIVR